MAAESTSKDDNLNNVRCKTSRTCRKKGGNIWKSDEKYVQYFW